MSNLLHRVFRGHWPAREYLGYDKYGFDLYGAECLICKHRDQLTDTTVGEYTDKLVHGMRNPK